LTELCGKDCVFFQCGRKTAAAILNAILNCTVKVKERKGRPPGNCCWRSKVSNHIQHFTANWSVMTPLGIRRLYLLWSTTCIKSEVSTFIHS